MNTTPSHADDHFEFAANGTDHLTRRRLLQGIGLAGLAAAGSSLLGRSAAAAAVAEIPEETAGPYPGDGSNGPNVLTQSGVIRSDIRSSFGSYSGSAAGVPTIDITVLNSNDGTPLVGAAVYLWHCTREGSYSLYTSGVTNQNYLRGVQVTDANGKITFTSIFPGCYSGRWPHLHFEVYPDVASILSVSNKIATSQFALPQDVCQAVYSGASGYSASTGNLAQISLASDNVFSDGYSQQMMTATGSVAAGYVLSGTAAVDAGTTTTPTTPPAAPTVTYGYTPMSPTRVLDTRDGTGSGVVAKLAQRGVLGLSLASRLPADAVAAVLNVTATNPTAPTYVTAYPAGTTQPTVSNLNINAAGDTVANLAVVALGGDRSVDLFNSAGSVDLVADLAGWFSASGTDRFVAASPSRVLDTRDGVGGATTVAAGGTVTLDLSGRLPADATAVVLNVTATNPTAPGYVTVFPAGRERPLASNLNIIRAGQTVPNLVAVQVGTGRRVSLYNASGTVDLVADLLGWYTPSGADEFVPLSPARVLDTRNRIGTSTIAQLGAGSTLTLALAGAVPATATAVVLNVTATNPTGGSYLTVYPAGSSRPYASNLNTETGQTVANLVTTPLGTGLAVAIYNSSGSVDVIADIAGYFHPAL